MYSLNTDLCTLWYWRRKKVSPHQYNINHSKTVVATDKGGPERERVYRGADKSLARRASRCILLDGENISFDISLVLYI